MTWIAIIVAILSGLVALASALPALPHPNGIVRSLGFPRMQILFVALLVLVLALLLMEGTPRWLAVVASGFAVVVQAVRIAPFSPLVPVRVARYDGPPQGQPGAAAHIRILATNVKQSNRRYDDAAALVLSCDPDIAIFMETDGGWVDALTPVLAHYEHLIAVPQDNGYGIIMATRLNLVEHEVLTLLNEEVPSIHCVFEVGEGQARQQLKAIAIHPEPPTPTHDTIGRDAEIGQVGLMVREMDGPAIVFGDLNDVAWSSTTRRFLRVSRLQDPRRGRGQYNSFDARYPIARWPLDHIFVSRHFDLVAMRRMPFIGSDHFPMFYEIALNDRESPSDEVEPADEDDIEELTDLVKTERERSRRPIGTDWEDA